MQTVETKKGRPWEGSAFVFRFREGFTLPHLTKPCPTWQRRANFCPLSPKGSVFAAPSRATQNPAKPRLAIPGKLSPPVSKGRWVCRAGPYLGWPCLALPCRGKLLPGNYPGSVFAMSRRASLGIATQCHSSPNPANFCALIEGTVCLPCTTMPGRADPSQTTPNYALPRLTWQGVNPIH